MEVYKKIFRLEDRKLKTSELLYMLQEAALAYLGLVLPANKVATWGNIINAAKNIGIISEYPNLWLAPGIAICLFVVCMTFFGNGLRDALDPTSR